MIDVSIDLETLDTKPSSFICAIGAVSFDIKTGEIFHEVYLPISLEYDQPGRTISADTVRWWLGQSADARAAIVAGEYGLDGCLKVFREWIETMPGCHVWGNGAQFDIAILEHAYNYNYPWEHWEVDHMKTILRHCQERGYQKPAFTGVKHNALEDAKYQAKVISECWNYPVAF